MTGICSAHQGHDPMCTTCVLSERAERIADLTARLEHAEAELAEARAWGEKREAAYQRLRSQRDTFRQERDAEHARAERLAAALRALGVERQNGVVCFCDPLRPDFFSLDREHEDECVDAVAALAADTAQPEAAGE